MDFDFIRSATSKELEQFKSVCNQLLSRTYIVRTLFRPGKGRVNNPDYTFLSLHYESLSLDMTSKISFGCFSRYFLVASKTKASGNSAFFLPDIAKGALLLK